MYDAAPVRPQAATTARTTCPYCGVGCGVTVTAGVVAGDATHPANLGRLCSKGQSLGETLGLSGRLLFPQIGERRATWNEALNLAAAKFSDAIARHGPQSVAFYLSGQFLTEDYYVANKLMKGFIGAANIDTNSRLCMASSVAGHIRAFGEDVVPGCYEDLDEADLVVSVGSNSAWCHPVLHRRIAAARAARGARFVVLDPRRTSSCDDADLHLPLAPGSDVALFNGLLAWLAAHNALAQDYIAAHTQGFEATLAHAKAYTPDAVANLTGLRVADLQRFYEMFASTRRVVTLYSQGVNQSSAGTDKVNAILNCHLATGRIGEPGMGPFSLTGQPNAMGGREVGGLANQLAAHMTFANPVHVDRVRRFWRAPNMATAPGLKAIDMFDAMRAGKIKALWIAGTNPAVSLPRSDLVREALRACPFVVVADVRDTDSTGFAQVRLPALGWSEKDGTVTNSERRISRQRGFVEAPGEARADWWMLTQLAHRMGYPGAFAYDTPAQIFREHAALSAFENDGERIFDLSGFTALSDAAYDSLEPVQWPVRVASESKRIYANGRYSTPDFRARFIPTPFRAPAEVACELRPLLLNTGRVRDQWHTMTRTGDVPRLAMHSPEPYLDMHAGDAADAGLGDGDFTHVQSRHGAALMRVRHSAAQRRGDVFTAMHWSEDNSSVGPADRLVGAACDPFSGQPELKLTSVAVAPQPMAWRGLLLTRDSRRLPSPDYWCRIAVERGFLYSLAGVHPLAARGEPPARNSIVEWLGDFSPADIAVYADPARGVFRFARFTGDELAACLYLAPTEAALPDRSAAAAVFARWTGSSTGTGVRAQALAGATASGRSVGAIICACHAVGRNTIIDAISGQHLSSVEAIGVALKAGTNCGSCKPELAALLRETQITAAVASPAAPLAA